MLSEFKKIESLLYVEDENDVREELKEFLENFCETLYTAENGAVGLELFKKHSPKIVVTDISMPVMNGIDMAKEMKNIDEDVHIIFTTAFSDTHYMQEAIKLHVTGYILKPIDLEILEVLIKKTIEILKLKEELENKTNILNEYLHIVDENVITSSTDLDGVITYVSQALCDISGYTKEELIGKTHKLLRPEDTPKTLDLQIWKALLKNKVWNGELKNKKKDGSFYWIQVNMYPIYDENGVKIGYTAIHHDITNLKRVEELSIRDGLTNAYNRRHFNETFPKYIATSRRKNDLICFTMLDIDHFKQYNDTYGHQKGDEVLIQVTQCIEKILNREEDIFFRLGGEEFGILFKATCPEKATSFINYVVESILNMHIPHESSKFCNYVTVSAGLKMAYAKSIINEDLMYQEADELLYQAKEGGRNRVISDMKEKEL